MTNSAVSLFAGVAALGLVAGLSGCATTGTGTATDAGSAASSAAATDTDVNPRKGMMLVDADGSRLARVFKVLGSGDVQIIIDGRAVTIPAGTLVMTEGRLATTLDKAEVLAL